ncbi:MAG: M23 family metallopeptidase [bacterium]|nr:M23 family metallopeptidase [bacterium]
MNLLSDLGEYGKTWQWYLAKKAGSFGVRFDTAKSVIVDKLVVRRGAYQRPFLHFGMMTLVVIGMVSAPVLINNYPTQASAADVSESPSSVLNTVTALSTKTTESEKPRRDIVEYTVQKGDTVSLIAKNYGVDIASIKALNPKLSVNYLSVGDVVKIPPVTGVIVTVKKGDTITALAKKYGLESSQPLVDWPYNSFANDETFELLAGQTLVIPGGVMPEEIIRPVYQLTPTQTLFARGSGALSWPASGTMTQYFSWYHNGDDIANGVGTPIAAADSGRVILAERSGYNGGYGKYIKVDHGNGLVTLYAHMSEVMVNVGDNVGRGGLLGKMGSTGRSTGSHLHFVVFSNGTAINPLSLLK